MEQVLSLCGGIFGGGGVRWQDSHSRHYAGSDSVSVPRQLWAPIGSPAVTGLRLSLPWARPTEISLNTLGLCPYTWGSQGYALSQVKLLWTSKGLGVTWLPCLEAKGLDLLKGWSSLYHSSHLSRNSLEDDVFCFACCWQLAPDPSHAKQAHAQLPLSRTLQQGHVLPCGKKRIRR